MKNPAFGTTKRLPRLTNKWERGLVGEGTIVVGIHHEVDGVNESTEDDHQHAQRPAADEPGRRALRCAECGHEGHRSQHQPHDPFHARLRLLRTRPARRDAYPHPL